METEERKIMNSMIASLHDPDDVFSYDIDKSRRIKFPRGFLRTFHTYRSFFPYIENAGLKDLICYHMMHRDTLHWLWLKTDIIAHAREMIVKFQLINLASILEALVKYFVPRMPKKKDNVYDRIDKMANNGIIDNPKELKNIWESRRSIHLHLSIEAEPMNFSDENYAQWHSALSHWIFKMKSDFENGIHL